MKKLQRFFLIWISIAGGFAALMIIMTIIMTTIDSTASFEDITRGDVNYGIGASIVLATLLSPLLFFLLNRSDKFKKENPDFEPKPYRPNWIMESLKYGTIMYLFMSTVPHWFLGKEFTTEHFLTNIPYWYGAGLTYGLFLKFFVADKKEANKR
ncbi:MAG: hypothetical protein R8N23_07165 [Reichenbachiella sp.]|uniref:hypothetical protein n=1 Tax=Reichenbachiella sp. TaxID=2184521 RepID=UPI0029665C7B|nr:hypothetical protein [Reichenbachiella sp.]MDW3209627.1 hypothetical protein [Reichenbachiella sp.]